MDGAIHYHGSPELMAQYAALARDAGIQIIGGCCGTTPDHIRAMREAIDTAPKRDHVDLSDVTTILGEPWKDIPKNDAPSPPPSPRLEVFIFVLIFNNRL